MIFKKSSNSIGACERLLHEPITFPRKISRTFHDSYQSNTASVCTACIQFTVFSMDNKMLIWKTLTVEQILGKDKKKRICEEFCSR